MKPGNRRRFASQRGDALIDAMVATVLVLILGMGPMYVATRAAVAQRDGASQQVAAAQLRSLLLSTPSSEICDSSGPLNAWASGQSFQVQSAYTGGPSLTLAVRAVCQNVTTTVAGVAVTRPMPTLIACLPSGKGIDGPLIIREGPVSANEPTTCETSA